jgi:ribonucleotide reductase alpha subunit
MKKLGFYAKDKNNNLFQFRWKDENKAIFEILSNDIWYKNDPAEFEILEIGVFVDEKEKEEVEEICAPFIPFSDEQIVNLISSACSGGSCYWLAMSGIPKITEEEKLKKECYEERILRLVYGGLEIRVLDTDSRELLGAINKERIEKATELMFKNHFADYANVINENDDAETADIWMQLVVMGEAIFG